MLLAKLAIAVLMFTFVVGCNRVSSPTGVAGVGHDHDHGGEKHPESLAEAIDAIAKSGKRILDAFKSGNPDDAHDELHDIGHLIESLPALGAKSGLTPEANSTIATANEKLMDAFGKLDESLHGGEEQNLDDITRAVESSLAELQSIVPSSGA